MGLQRGSAAYERHVLATCYSMGWEGAKPQTINPCTESAWWPTGLDSFFYSGCSEAACVTYFDVPEHKLYNTMGLSKQSMRAQANLCIWAVLGRFTVLATSECLILCASRLQAVGNPRA